MIYLLVLLVVVCLVGFVLKLADKIDKQEREIRKIKSANQTNSFSIKIIETELLLNDMQWGLQKMISDNQRMIENAELTKKICEKFSKDTEEK